MTMLVNIDRLHTLMDNAGLDAIVVRSGVNVTYLSGVFFPGTLQRHLDLVDSPRGIFVVWPRHGESAIVVNPLAEPLARRDTWLDRVEVHAGYSERPIERVCAVLQSAGLGSGRIGFEQAAINAVDWALLDSLLPNARRTDCTALLDRVRWIKTPGEIALLREAANLLDDAYLEVFPTIRAEPESAVHARIIESCIRHGAGWAHGILHSGRNTVVYGGESAMLFQPGDVIRTDYVSYYKGYPGHQSRTVILGKPSAQQRATYGRVRDVYLRVIDLCCPGALTSAIYAQTIDMLRGIGAHTTPMLCGHGVGAWWHQQEPLIAAGASHRLEVGMVLALEPYLDHWHIQDMVEITADGPVLLSAKFDTTEPFAIAL